MSKQSGLGMALYIGGNNLSGDTQSIDTLSGSQAVIETTDITQSGKSRIFGLRDGKLDWTSFFDPATSHPVLAALPTTDTQVMIGVGTAIGSPAAAMTGIELDYAGNRAASGEFTFKVSTTADGFGLEWGSLLTAGVRTDTTATNGASLDTLASAAFGGQAYLQVMAVTGTSVTVAVQDSADNSTFAAVTGLAFTAATPGGSPQVQRLALANNATIRRYVRVVTTGTFTNAQFAVMLNKNSVAGQTF